MRILSLVTHGSGGYGGIAQYNRDLMSALASLPSVESIRVLVRLPERGDEEEQPLKMRQERGGRNRLFYSARALMLAIRCKPDVIFCGHLYMTPLAWAVAALLRKPLWVQLHGLEAWQKPSPAIRYAVERADLITVVSRYTRGRFLTWANVNPDAVRVLPNTFEVLPGEERNKEGLKARYGLAGRKVILTVSRIDRGDRYKGHEKVLTLLPRLLQSHPGLMYVIVGDGEDRGRLESVAAHLSVSASVRFTGKISREDLRDYYRLADLFVMPSTKEGFGIVFLEAAAFGLPVIGGNADGSTDALADGLIGDAVDPGSLDALMDAINPVLNGQRKPAQSAERFAREHFLRHLDRLMTESFQRA